LWKSHLYSPYSQAHSPAIPDIKGLGNRYSPYLALAL